MKVTSCSGVIAVVMRIDDEAHRALVDAADGGEQLLGQRLELVVGVGEAGGT